MNKRMRRPDVKDNAKGISKILKLGIEKAHVLAK